jgi:hypothetical protein
MTCFDGAIITGPRYGGACGNDSHAHLSDRTPASPPLGDSADGLPIDWCYRRGKVTLVASA